MQPDTTLPKEPKVKEYIGLITQNNTDDPFMDSIFKNNIGEIVWTRGGTGYYEGTLIGAFQEQYKIWAILGQSDLRSPVGIAQISRNNDDSVYITTYDMAGTLTDNMLLVRSLEIRIYQ